MEKPEGLKERIEKLERELILDSLRRNNWNKTATAHDLGISRPGLYNKLRHFGLDR